MAVQRLSSRISAAGYVGVDEIQTHTGLRPEFDTMEQVIRDVQ